MMLSTPGQLALRDQGRHFGSPRQLWMNNYRAGHTTTADGWKEANRLPLRNARSHARTAAIGHGLSVIGHCQRHPLRV